MSGATPSEKPEQIDLTKLNLQQLQQLKMEFETVIIYFKTQIAYTLKNILGAEYIPRITADSFKVQRKVCYL